MDNGKATGDIVVWEERSATGSGGDREGEATMRTVTLGGSAGEEAPVLRIISSGFGERAAQGASASRPDRRDGARMSLGRAA